MNRREFISSGLSALGMGAIAAPIRSVVGAAETGMGESPVPTAADYISDGLVMLIDGIENAEYGVHEGGMPPSNLISGIPVSAEGNIAYGDDCFTLASQAYMQLEVPGIGRAIDSCDFTLQICGKFGNQGHNVPLFGIGNRGMWIWRGNNFSVVEMNIKTTGYNDVSSVRYLNFDRFSFSVVGGLSPYVNFSDGYEVNARYGTLTNVDTDIVQIGRMGTFGSGNDRQYCSVRMYNRVLTPVEIRYNYLIDTMRFGL